MTGRRTAAAVLNIILAAAAAALFAALIALNAMRRYSDVRIPEFCIVPLCLVFALCNFKNFASVDGILTVLALIFTTCADYVMVLLNTNYPLSLCFFAAAQVTYCVRIQLMRRDLKYLAISLPLRVIVCAATVIGIGVPFEWDALLVLAAFYFTNLIFNAAEALLMVKRGLKNILFFAGLLLFAGCDICVGLNSAGEVGLELSAAGLYAVNILIWVFYMPSQILIALSAGKPKEFFKKLFRREDGRQTV